MREESDRNKREEKIYAEMRFVCEKILSKENCPDI